MNTEDPEMMSGPPPSSSSPAAFTGYGFATGLATMLLSLGPSVLFLYKKRADQRRGSRQK